MKASVLFTPETLKSKEWLIPVFKAEVPAGKADRLDESTFEYVDLNKRLIRNPRSTYGLTAYGDSMVEENIDTGDLLIVDRSAQAQINDIVIMMVDGEYTVKRLTKIGRHLWLLPGNQNRTPMKLPRDQDCEVWGVVKYIIKKVR